MLATFSALDERLLARVRPNVVICPLFKDSYDAIHVVTQLTYLGYRGQLFALGPPLPNPSVVLAEVRSLAPMIDFKLVSIASVRELPQQPPQRPR